jgi:hypothetical protein
MDRLVSSVTFFLDQQQSLTYIQALKLQHSDDDPNDPTLKLPNQYSINATNPYFLQTAARK